jgi:hypothetical protein
MSANLDFLPKKILDKISESEIGYGSARVEGFGPPGINS